MGHPRFYEVMGELRTLHDRKNSDYAKEDDPLSNLRMCAEAGIRPWGGVIVRLTDKISRLMQVHRKIQGGEEAAVKSETIVDTFKDIANYAIFGVVLYEEEEERSR